MRLAAFLACLFSTTMGQAGGLAIPENCGQVVLVTSRGWNSPAATLQRWTRGGPGEPWKQIGGAVPVLIGERGLGWGIGLHSIPDNDGPRKAEGDRRAPAGIFRLTSAFGRTAQAVGRLPWQPITPGLEAIDDPASRFYNRIVNRTRIDQPDWHSSEKMAAIPDYALGVVVAHNPQHFPGSGSCIFIHLWRGKRAGTAGCTVLREPDLVALVRWLDPAEQPVLVQLPQAIAHRELKGF